MKNIYNIALITICLSLVLFIGHAQASNSMVFNPQPKMIITSQDYIDKYFTWKFTQVNDTTWKAEFTIDKNLLADTSKLSPELLCNVYFSNLDCSNKNLKSLSDASILSSDMANITNYPVKSLTEKDASFSKVNVDLGKGEGSFYFTSIDGFKEGDTFKFGFNSTSVTYSSNVEVCGSLTGYDNVTVNPGVTVTVCGVNATTGTGFWNVTTNAGGTINMYGRINGVGKGSLPGFGYGAGTKVNGGGGGGSYGGAGGAGGTNGDCNSPGQGGPTYGDNTNLTVYYGSGGGNASSGNCAGGGGDAGGYGGAMVIFNSSNIMVSGIIDLNGTNGASGVRGGGGGSGGGLLLAGGVVNISNSKLYVAGGNGGDGGSMSGGGAGGGRIKIYYDLLYNSSTITNASKGVGGVYGGNNGTDGTIYYLGSSDSTNGITINNVYDELTLAPICYNVTMFNVSYSYSTFACGSIFTHHLLSPLGDVQLVFTNTSYQLRNYYLTNFTNTSAVSMNVYLLKLNESSYITGFIYSDQNLAGEVGAIIKSQKFINSSWTTVDEKLSDYQGKFYFYMYPYTTYKIIATKGILNTTIDNFYPNPSIILNIYLNGSTVAQNTLWTGVNYYITPTDTYLGDGITRFNFTISDSNNDLQYFFMGLYRVYNGTSTAIYTLTNTTSNSGGQIPVDVNVTTQYLAGMDIIQMYVVFKRAGFDSWNNTVIYHYNGAYTNYDWNYSITQALSDFANGGILQSQGLKYAFVFLVALSGTLAVASMSGNTMGSMIVFVSITALFAYAGFFGTSFLDRWGFVAVLALIGTGIGFWRGWI